MKKKIEDLIFVVAGAGGWPGFDFFEEIKKYPIDPSLVISTGYLDKEELPILYSHALFFVFNSIYEGFGLPPLEAMKCGCPVITSNTSSLPEVVGDAGIMIDPTDEKALIQAYTQLYDDQDLRDALIVKGLMRAGSFTWKKTVDKMVGHFMRAPTK